MDVAPSRSRSLAMGTSYSRLWRVGGRGEWNASEGALHRRVLRWAGPAHTQKVAVARARHVLVTGFVNDGG
jgi:hypothetical protein